jgi:L-2-hydroxycarboxylate dehydrogenase (NAD+)
MKVSLPELKAKMTDVLTEKGYAKDDVPFIINMYLGGEVIGHTTHGLASFPGFVNQDFSGLPEPEVIKATHALFMIDAKSNSGNVVARRAADEAIKRAKNEGVGIAIIKNMDVLLRPGGVAQYIAERGLVGVVMESGGAANIAPPGGYDPVIGTNPIAYGIPMEGAPLVVDMAMSKRAYGNVRLAKKFGNDLPEDTFYNDKGEVTLDPEDAHSVMPAGEHKGFALALLIEILCGSALGMDMMVSSKAQNNFGSKLPERGAYILVIDPSQTSGAGTFVKENAALIKNIKATRAVSGQTIRIPGDNASSRQVAAKAEDSLELPDELWEEIKGLDQA